MENNYNMEYNPGNLKGAMKAAGATSRDLWYVPFGKLVIREGFNVRVKDDAYRAHVRAIADSIKVNGFYPDEPLGVIVDGDDIVVHAGHCRHDAVSLAISEGASVEEIPCVSVPRGTSAEDLTVALHTTNSGKPLTPYELGIVCKRLVGYGMDEAKIASRLALSLSYIGQLLDLMSAPAELRMMVQEGKMSAGTAIDLFRKHGVAAVTVATTAVGNAEAEGKTRATRQHIEVDSDTKLERAAKAQGLNLYKALKEMLEDPAYLKIKEVTRAKVRDAFDAIDRKVS